MNKKQFLFLLLASTVSTTFSMGLLTRTVRVAMRRGIVTGARYSAEGLPEVKLVMVDGSPFIRPDKTKGPRYNNWLYAATSALPDLFNYFRKVKEIEIALVANHDITELDIYKFIEKYDVVPNRLPHGPHIPVDMNRVERMAEILEIDPAQIAVISWGKKLLREGREAGAWRVGVASQGMSKSRYMELSKKATFFVGTSYDAVETIGAINTCLRMGELPENFKS